ncbi:MAG: hypothetical protein JST55_14425 [Bacteroidetes bacterium]|nr:hypothetical protein [Bacteroidota bacterium]
MNVCTEEKIIKRVTVLALVDIEAQQAQDFIAQSVRSHKVEIFVLVAAVAVFIHIAVYVKFVLRCIANDVRSR